MRRILIALSIAALPGCVVLEPHPSHPHGGPPGQMKKSHDHGHHHGRSCGHKRKKDGRGHWVYLIEGRWVVVLE